MQHVHDKEGVIERTMRKRKGRVKEEEWEEVLTAQRRVVVQCSAVRSIISTWVPTDDHHHHHHSNFLS